MNFNRGFVSFSTALIVIAATSLLLLPVGNVLAATVQCRATEWGVAQFMHPIEGLCSPCSVPVCRTFDRLPDSCICQCVRDYPERKYRPQDELSCQPAKSTTDIPEGPPGSVDVYRICLIVGCAVLAAACIVLALLLFISVRRNRSLKREKVSNYQEMIPLTMIDNKCTKSEIPPDGVVVKPVLDLGLTNTNNTPSMPAEMKLETEEDISMTVAAQPPPTTSIVPRQETDKRNVHQPSDTEETLGKTRAQTGVQEEGPIKPSERAPIAD